MHCVRTGRSASWDDLPSADWRKKKRKERRQTFNRQPLPAHYWHLPAPCIVVVLCSSVLTSNICACIYKKKNKQKKHNRAANIQEFIMKPTGRKRRAHSARPKCSIQTNSYLLRSSSASDKGGAGSSEEGAALRPQDSPKHRGWGDVDKQQDK